MSTPIDRLAREIVRDNAIVFIGSQLRATAGEPPLLQQIAWRLAQQITAYDGPTDELTAVAEAFELDAGRPELIRSLREISEGVDDHAADIIRQLARTIAPYTKVITTRFDRAFESALEDANKLYVSIVRDDDVRQFDETRVALVKLRGDIRLDDTLILTPTDFERFLEALPVVNDVVRAFFATKTLIFLGYDLDDPLFRRLFVRVSDRLGIFRRAAYAVVPGEVPPRTQKFWRKAQVQIHVEPDLTAFLQHLQAAITAAIPPENIPPALIANPLAARATPPRPSEPYKALASYTLGDAAVFAGRKDEARRLANRILGHRMVVLYGESGSGKTSLLQAGTQPALAEKRALLVSCEPIAGQPLDAALQAALRVAVEGTDLPAPEGADLPAQLHSLQEALDGPLVLAVDQFEQIFVALSADERTAVLATLQTLRQQKELDLRIVVVIREDFLGRLQTVEPQLPDLLDTRFRLDRLGIEDARAAIEQPAGEFGIVWETELVDRLLQDLAGENGIAPPQLQIVCKRLWDDARQAAAEASRPFKEIADSQFTAAGGTQAILGDYIERVVAALPLPQQETARRLLGAMVSSSRTKLRLPADELARAADCDVATAVAILDHLREERLVSRITAPDAPFPAYELTHDYLALRIIHWLGPDFWEMQRARELLRTAVPEWEAHGRLIGPGDLQAVSQHRGDLQLNAAELAVVYAAAVSYDAAPSQWRERLPDADVSHILLRLATNPDAFVRRAALPHLAPFAAQSDVAAALAGVAVADPDPDARRIAATTIGAARSVTAVDRLAASTSDAPQNTAGAFFALTESWPAADRQIPPALRTAVRRLRWQAHGRTLRNAAGRGFVGGMIALGGLGLIQILTNPELPMLLRGMYHNDANIHGSNISAIFVTLGGLVGEALGLFVYMGLFGGMVLAIAAGLRALFNHIIAPAGRFAWVLVSSTAAVLLGGAYVLIATLSTQSFDRLQTFAAGLAVGFVTCAAVLAPWQLSERMRTAVVLIISALLYVLLYLGELFFFQSWLAALLAGLLNGMGFLVALPRLPMARREETMLKK